MIQATKMASALDVFEKIPFETKSGRKGFAIAQMQVLQSRTDEATRK